MAAKQAAAAAGAQNNAKFLVLPVVILLMAQMGTSGENSALGLANLELVSKLGATVPDIQLANMVYSLIAGALMVAGGLLGTVIGWKRNFRMGALLCALGEIVMAFSPNMTVLIWGGRVLVGLGASFMIPSVLGLVPKIYHGKNRVQAYGCIGAASGLAAVLPLIIGMLMENVGFRFTYIVLGCYFLLVLLLSFKLPAIEEGGERGKFDGVGTGLAAAGLFLFLIGLSRISVWGLTTPFAEAPFTIFGLSPALPMVVLGLVLIVTLLFVEKRIEAKKGSALLPQAFLKTPQVLAGLVASALTFFFMGIQTILLSPYLMLVAGWSAATMGAMSLLTGIPMFLLAMLIPKLMPNANPRHVLQLGYIVMAGSLLLMYSSISEDGVGIGMYIGFFLVGVGSGISSSHTNNVVALALSDKDAAQSGGVQTNMRNVGQAIGVAALGAVLLFGITSNINAAMEADPDITPTVREAVSQRSITLMSDESFLSTISDIDMTEQEKADLVAINSKARVDASKTAFIVAAVIMAAGLLTTPFITVLRKEEEGATAKQPAAAGLDELEPAAR